jgi:hypothetical protein
MKTRYILGAILMITVVGGIYLLTSPKEAKALDYGPIHCNYLELINGFQCQDSDGYITNEWYAPDHVPTQEMNDYYLQQYGYVQPSPDTNFLTYSVSESGTLTLTP